MSNENKDKQEIVAGVLVEALKLIVDTTPNDADLGERVRQVFKHVEIETK